MKKNISKKTVKRFLKNSAIAKKPVSKIKTLKSKKVFAQTLQITDLKQNTKRKILTNDKSFQKPDRGKQNRLSEKDVNLESEKPHNKKKQRENQK